MEYERIIIGAGIYGLYAALKSVKNKHKVLVIEKDDEAFMRATYINQARVHMGYHYPRSISTALRSKNYFERFCRDYKECILEDFDQVYATSSDFSWTNGKEFENFCRKARIKCERVDENKYFKNNMCDGAFITKEYTYDARILKDLLLKELNEYAEFEIRYGEKVTDIKKTEVYTVITDKGSYDTPYLINTTYASVNEIHRMLGIEPFGIKYELCEIILCKVNDKFKKTGITVMDGPFFSIMPFGKTGYHSLTSVTFTPHVTSYDSLPVFDCQKKSNGYCKPECLGNCNNCIAKPDSAWPYMSNLARKYLNDDLEFEYVESLYSMKPIFKTSEIDDSRPTIIRKYTENPTFISCVSGKINTVYDLDEVLDD